MFINICVQMWKTRRGYLQVLGLWFPFKYIFFTLFFFFINKHVKSLYGEKKTLQ